MSRRLIVAVVTIILTSIASIWLFAPRDKQTKNSRFKPPDRVLLRIVHPPEVESILASAVEQYSLSKPKLPDGTPIAIKLIKENSVSASQKIARGELKTDGWIANSSLINYVNSFLRNLGPRQVDCHILFSTPIVAAIRARDSQLFKVKERTFSWGQIISDNNLFSKSEDGAILYFSHGHPRFSDSGLLTLIQLAYFASGKTEVLLDNDVRAISFEETMKRFQSYAAGYGFDDKTLLANIAQSRGGKLHFTLTTEQSVALFNYRLRDNITPLIAIYPEEGSYWQDFSLCTSDADWVTPGHVLAISKFAEFLLTPPLQEAAKNKGFRPVLSSIQLTAPLSRDFGIETSLPKSSFLPVPGEVVNFLLESWQYIRKPSAIEMVLDTSGSMEGASLRLGKNFLRNVGAFSSDRDVKGLISFSSEVTVHQHPNSNNSELVRTLDSLEALGGSAVYDAIKKALEELSLPEFSDFRKTMLVYTDGEDKNSVISLQALIDFIETTNRTQNIDIVVVGINRDSDLSDLQQIASAANGTFYSGSLDDMERIFSKVLDGL